ncbi:MAG TPA: menaquinone biosynthesis protein [Chitinophagaceae bacterium]|nr:menaquinone biosynthesis protein [Chitinophagaceae bacterium]
MKKIRVGIVNYLNTKPLIYGLERSPIKEQIDLVGAYPSRLAQMLIDDEIDVGLIPVAAIPQLPSYHIVGNYCIGAEGEIASVCLFSEVPMNEITRVYLDYQSRSSVALLKWLMKESWGIHPELIEATDESYRNEIKGTTAGLVIGDRALEQRKISTFIYDLGSEWRSITGLPFVFAAWVSTRPLSETFIRSFDIANELGLTHIDEIVQEMDYTLYDLNKYYNLHLSYGLDERKRKGLSRFLDVIKLAK